MKLFKRILITILILTTISSLSYGAFVAKSMYEKYNSTMEWRNSSLQSKIHQVPPELAQNYISIEDQKMLTMLTEINEALEEIKENKEIKEDKFGEYWDLYNYALNEIEQSEEHKGLLKEGVFNDFAVYLKSDLAIKKAYENLQIEDLEEYEKILSDRLLNQNNEVDKAFLNKLQTIAKDFSNLESFSNDSIKKLGIVENNVLKVDVKVNREITDDLLEQIEKSNLKKFAHIRNLYSILNSESWNKILSNNKDSLEYYSWKESQKILDSLLQSNYLPVSSFNTVEDVLSYSPSIKLEERENYSINKDSIIKEVYYNGQKLNSNLYVKKGTSLNFVIDYQYTENPKSKITIEYIDNQGNKLDVKTYEGYVGKPIVVEKDIEGYVLLEVKNELSEFPKEDSKIQFVYEKHIPKIEESEVKQSEIGTNEKFSDKDSIEINGNKKPKNENIENEKNEDEQ